MRITMWTIFSQGDVMGTWGGVEKLETFLCDEKHVKSVDKVPRRVVLNSY